MRCVMRCVKEHFTRAEGMCSRLKTQIRLSHQTDDSETQQTITSKIYETASYERRVLYTRRETLKEVSDTRGLHGRKDHTYHRPL